ncbi:VTT domain-containing protein [Polynucleobacter sp. JS-Safj-400b-B2]|uniref:DedA family protein n=1 Tax=Polynucleobacter sp. JS-Safj-400b-B2 TaxID=2576921 RepID=UPI001C0B506A|nr:VTT domain-containing protein [Polynucleobacter sp. JS-Safj-400b-B2]MBU3626875.1 VTT domain-containing protein [Polynucleobacter sp. JS-Safj-400b-B2]
MPIYDILEKNYEAFTQMPHHPAYLMLGLVLISFLFEDVAVAAGVAFSTAGSLLWSESFLAVWFGIAIGDLLLYAAGYFSRRIPFLKRRFVDGIANDNRLLGKHKLAGTIFLARVTPGLRLISYVYLGLKHVNLWTFTFLVMFAVLVWTASLYLGSIYLGSVIAEALPIPKTLAVALPLLILALITFIYPWIKSRRRKT